MKVSTAVVVALASLHALASATNDQDNDFFSQITPQDLFKAKAPDPTTYLEARAKERDDLVDDRVYVSAPLDRIQPLLDQEPTGRCIDMA